MKVLFLCAGEGSRFRPWTNQVPKPALPCMNIPMAAYPYYWSEEISPSAIAVNTHHLGNKIRDLFQSDQLAKVPVYFSDETSLLMGPAGALKKAASFLKDDHFLTMNGDEIFLPSKSGYLPQALSLHKQKNALCTLIVMKHPEAGKKFGAIWTTPEGKVEGFGKVPPNGKNLQPWHFIGTYFSDPRLLHYIPENQPSNIFYDVLCHLLEKELVQIFEVDGFWHETGNIRDYLKTHQLLLELVATGEKTYPYDFLKNLFQNWNMPLQIHRLKNGLLATDHFRPKYANFHIEGFVVLGKGQILPERKFFQNCVIAHGAQDGSIPDVCVNTLIL